MLYAKDLSKLKSLLENELSLSLQDDELYHAAIAIARFVCGKELRLAEINNFHAKGEKYGKEVH